MPRMWDLFCRVIDNFGDIGVCWRLAVDLANRGERVRLWVDDPRALAWMAPGGNPGVQVHEWPQALSAPSVGDVVIEAFACNPPDAFIAEMARKRPAPVWINLEYLSAEAWVERCHGLPSPRLVEPGRGMRKWFFQPGFSVATGGLLREPGLLEERAAFDRKPWLRDRLGLHLQPGEALVVVFCYDASPVEALAQSLTHALAPSAAMQDRRALIALAPGAAQQATQGLRLPEHTRTVFLPWLSQQEFDRLLWSADLNFVRGEDSAVRAMWAGAPFIWQLYPQQDLAHQTKAQAFVRQFLAQADPTPEVRQAVSAWWDTVNGLTGDAFDVPEWPSPRVLQDWAAACGRWRRGLCQQPDLCSALLHFVSLREGSPQA